MKIFDLLAHGGKPFHCKVERDKIIKVMLHCFAWAPPRDSKASASEQVPGSRLLASTAHRPYCSSREGTSGLQPHNKFMKGPVQAAVVPQLTRGAYRRGVAGILPCRPGLSQSGPQPAPGELIPGLIRAGCRRKLVPAAMVTYRMLYCSSLPHAQ